MKKSMKARIINAAIWAAIAITLCVAVGIQWHNNGCEVKSLVLAIAMYTSMSATLCGVIDQTIKEKQE